MTEASSGGFSLQAAAFSPARLAELSKMDGGIVLDDSWSTDRITAEGREKLRAAGFADEDVRVLDGLDVEVFLAFYPGMKEWLRQRCAVARTLDYLAMNPVDAGFCERPEDWRWSSFSSTGT